MHSNGKASLFNPMLSLVFRRRRSCPQSMIFFVSWAYFLAFLMFALFHNPEVAQAQQDVVQAQHFEPECVLPRRENTSYQTNDPPILTAKLVEPEVFDCLLKTAERGKSREALEWSQILLWEGKIDDFRNSLFGRSETRLKKYIDIGVQLGSHYSMLAKAAYLQDIDPATALKLYRRVAKEDDCRGQAMLGYMYQQGIGVEIN